MDSQRSSGFWKAAIVASLCIGYALYSLVRMPSNPTLLPDSIGYLEFSPIRTLGYPLFLSILGTKGAVVTQTLLFALALWCLSVEALRLTSSVLLPAAIVGAVTLTPDVFEYHGSVLTESLFIAGTLMFLASTIRFVREPSASTAALAATIAGLTSTIRPSGMALMPVHLVMVLLQWHRLPGPRLVVFTAAIVPALLLVAGERTAVRAMYRHRPTSLVGRHVFAKAALIDAPPPSHPAPSSLQARLERHLAVTYAPMRDLIDRAPPDLRTTLMVFYERCLQAQCVPELGTTPPGSEDLALSDAMAQVGTERLLRAPLQYATQAAMDYGALWTVYRLRHPVTAPRLNAYIAAHRPLPFERDTFAIGPDQVLTFQPAAPVRFLQPVVIAIGWLTGGLALIGVAAAASRRQLPPALAAGSLAALTAQGILLFTALSAAGIARFMVSAWPATMTAVLFGAWWFLDVTAPYARTRNRSAAG